MADIRARQKRVVRAMKEARDTFLPISIRELCLFRLVQSWIFQGFAGAHWTELTFRFCLELLFALSLWWGLSLLMTPVLAAVLGLVTVHTMMWTFNGHFWALKISENKRLVRNSPDRIERYIEGLERRLVQTEFITACVLSGSLTRGKFHQYSDLDMWFTRRKGFFNALWAYSLGIRERSIAFLQRIPLELYFYDPDDYSGKDTGEILLLVKDCEERWKMVEPESISLKDYPWNEMEFFTGKQDESCA